MNSTHRYARLHSVLPIWDSPPVTIARMPRTLRTTTDRVSAALRRRAAVILLLPVLAACGSITDGPAEQAPLPALVVGSGTSAQSELIARLYAGALERMGTRVTTALDIGDRRAYLSALDANGVTLVPEFSGELLAYLNRGATQRMPDDVDEELSRSLPQGLSVSDMSETAEWRSGVTLAGATARRYGVTSLADLGPHCGELTLGVPDDEPAQAVLREEYGCAFAAIRHYPAAGLSTAAATGEIQAAVTTPAGAAVTTPAGTAGPPVLLTDDKYAVRAENVLPLYRAGALSARQIKKLNMIAGELTTADLVEMVGRIVADKGKAADLARSWLDLHGF